MVAVISKTRTYSIWVLCLYFVASLTTGLHGSVLCIDANEGVKVEAICQPCCDEEEEVCEVTALGHDTEKHPRCVDCTDIPLIYESLLVRNFRSILIDDPAVFSPADAEYVKSTVLTISQLACPAGQNPPASHLNSLSTTILIC